jgi:uncharacterized protein with NRDE domain
MEKNGRFEVFALILTSNRSFRWERKGTPATVKWHAAPGVLLPGDE